MLYIGEIKDVFFFDEEIKDNQLKNYYLAYFDILGYKSYFEDEKNDPYEFLLVIKDSFEDIKKGVNITQSLNQIDIKYRVFSDNFLFYVEDTYDELEVLVSFSYLISLIQRRLLEKYSLLIRGGITKGKFFVNDDLLFGKGLIDVYTLENELAIYPRVIVDKRANVFSDEILKSLENNGFITKDVDDFYFIQYLSALGELSCDAIKINIKKMVNNCRYRTTTDIKIINQKERLISKYLWLITRFNSFMDTKKDFDNKIEFDTKINSRVLKVEVTCK